jgi:hypothetical protein
MVTGWSFPRASTVRRFVQACGELDAQPWVDARSRVAASPESVTHPGQGHVDDVESLLLRVYVPSGRLYAGEMHRILGLFGDWLTGARGHGIRQAGYRTQSGEMFEFFADAAVAQPILRQEFDIFTHFLELCAGSPSKAADVLDATGIGKAAGSELVERFGREFRRLRVDLKHERERRMLTLRHSLEGELLEGGVDLDASAAEVDSLLERLVPEPSALSPLSALGASSWPPAPYPGSAYIGQQVINAMEYTVIHNIQGTVSLGVSARELLSLADHFGGPDAVALKSAVHELEDGGAPVDKREATKKKIKSFLGQLSGKVEEIALSVLEKYVESKLGLP